MKNLVQRAWMGMVATVLACTVLPAEAADAAVVCGYVRVQLTTVPLVTLCSPMDCNGLDNPPIVVGPTETYVCVMV